MRILADTDRVDWNKRDKWGRTPLYFALYHGRTDIINLIENRTAMEDKQSKRKNKSNNENRSAAAVEKNMNRVRNMKMRNEELKEKIKRKESELLQLKSKSDNYVASMTEELNTIETKLRVSLDTKMKAEEEMLRLQGIIRDCDQSISRMAQEKWTRETLIDRTFIKYRAAKDNLSEEKENLDRRIKTVDSLVRGEISKIRVAIKRKREENARKQNEKEKNMENLDKLEYHLEENKRGKLSGEYIEYKAEEINKEIKMEDTDEDNEYMEQPQIKLEKQEIKEEISKEMSECCDNDIYDLKVEHSVKVEPWMLEI